MMDMVKRIRNRTVGCLAICAVLGSRAWADPNIQVTGVEGSFDHGALVTITGLGFGTKEPALPFLWDDFEGHTVGQSIGDPVYGRYTRVGSAVYNATAPYSGSHCAYSFVNPSMATPGLVSDWVPAEVTDAVASMKIKLISTYGSLTPFNIKLLRLNTADPDPTHGRPNYNIGKERTLDSFYGIVNHGLIPGCVYTGGFSGLPNPDGWNSLSIYDHIGDLETANGFVGRELNGVVEERRDIVTLRSGGDSLGGLRSAYFCGYFTHEGYDSHIYIDDVYADTTLARVIVQEPDGGNFEMQIPQEWNQSSIQVLVNTGAYPSGTELALVVYDADNNASAPFVVTVGENSGGGGDLGPPGMPSTPYFE